MSLDEKKKNFINQLCDCVEKDQQGEIVLKANSKQLLQLFNDFATIYAIPDCYKKQDKISWDTTAFTSAGYCSIAKARPKIFLNKSWFYFKYRKIDKNALLTIFDCLEVVAHECRHLVQAEYVSLLKQLKIYDRNRHQTGVLQTIKKFLFIGQKALDKKIDQQSSQIESVKPNFYSEEKLVLADFAKPYFNEDVIKSCVEFFHAIGEKELDGELTAKKLSDMQHAVYYGSKHEVDANRHARVILTQFKYDLKEALSIGMIDQEMLDLLQTTIDSKPENWEKIRCHDEFVSRFNDISTNDLIIFAKIMADNPKDKYGFTTKRIIADIAGRKLLDFDNKNDRLNYLAILYIEFQKNNLPVGCNAVITVVWEAELSERRFKKVLSELKQEQSQENGE